MNTLFHYRPCRTIVRGKTPQPETVDGLCINTTDKRVWVRVGSEYVEVVAVDPARQDAMVDQLASGIQIGRAYQP